MELPLTHLNHIRVSRALDAVDRNKRHIPRIKLPLQPSHFYAVLCNIDFSPSGNMFRAILLTLYYGVLRQSELIPRSVNAWDPHTQPTRGDLSLSDDKCVIFIKKAKNMQRYDQNRSIIMQAALNKFICPVRAFKTMLQCTPTYHYDDPLFMFHDSRKPVPATYVLKMLHSTMSIAGLSGYIPQTSLHSIRKSAATDAYMAGCSEHSIRSYGGWSSSAYKTYIHTSNIEVNRSLITRLDCQHE